MILVILPIKIGSTHSVIMHYQDTDVAPRFLNAAGEQEAPDEILLPGFLALQLADLAGYFVSNIAYNLSRALLFMFWF